MRQVAREMKPICMEDISALIALYRPGPLDTGMIEKFIGCKNGTMKLLIRRLAGTDSERHVRTDRLSRAGHADRPAVRRLQPRAGRLVETRDGKKKPEEMEKQREIFVVRLRKNGVCQEIANTLFDHVSAICRVLLQQVAQPGICDVDLSDRISEDALSCEYMTSLLIQCFRRSRKSAGLHCRVSGDEHRHSAARRKRSGPDFTAVGQTIRFGLSGVKNVGEAAVPRDCH